MNLHWEKLTDRAAQVLAEPVPPAPHSVPSPCVSVCVMNPQTGWCEGCMRSLQEIGDWSRASDEAKRQVWQQIPVRLLQRQSLDR
jgi:uncharacterized protein